MKKWFEEKILTSNKKTLFFIGAFVFFALFIWQAILLARGTYYNSSSDDVVQYSVIVRQYVEMFKSGDFSWFNFSNNFGASFFADVYYLPLDIFFFLTLLLSLVCHPLIAFSCVELIKILLGVITFAFFLQKCKFNNKIVMCVAFVYFCAGGVWAFSVFPTYFSLFFYLPFSLLVVKWFFKGKKWILPLYCLLLVFYNFYNAYSLFIFMVFVYIVIKIRDDYKGVKDLIKNVICFGLHIVLGVLMSLVILLPSVLYIVKYSTRDESSFEFLFDLQIYMKMIYRLFVYESGTVNLAEIMVQDGIYYQSHFSYYLGLLGLYIISFLFVMKDRTSRIYKWSIVVAVCMMFIPAFSMLYSGVMVAYTRWFTYINVILLYYLAYVLDTIDFEKIEKRDKNKVLMGLLGLFFVVLTYNVVMFFVGDSIDKMYYAYCFVLLIIFGSFGVMYFIFALVKQKRLIYSMFVVEMLIALALNFSVPFSTKHQDIINEFDKINYVLENLELESNMERVYLTEKFKYNNNRLTNTLTNESTFHSFLPYPLYEFETLYSLKENDTLTLFGLNNLSLNAKRIMDYKYIVVDKKDDYGLEYLNKYYEDDTFIVYENVGYNPFYVYESYYDLEDVMGQRSDKSDFLHFGEMLNEGVILEKDNYNLNKKEFTYLNSESNNLNFSYKTTLNESDGKYVEHVGYDYGYSGTLYIYGEEVSKLKKAYIEENDSQKICDLAYDGFVCEFEGNFENIVFESSELINYLNYVIVVEKEDAGFFYKEIKGMFSKDYISYSIDVGGNVSFADSNDNVRKCTQDFCSLYNFDEEYMLVELPLRNFVNNDNQFHLTYQEGFINEHIENDSAYANNKHLSHDGSTINVRYTRISETQNDQVIVLPVTYSDEWKINNNDCKLVRANGGFLGIIVKKGIKNVDVLMTFEPTGARIGCVGTCVGLCIYGAYVAFIFYKRKKEND